MYSNMKVDMGQVVPDLKQHKKVTCYLDKTLELRPGEEQVVPVRFSAKIPKGLWVDDQYDCSIESSWGDESDCNGKILVGRCSTEQGGFLWEGDGTCKGQTYVKNTHANLALRIENPGRSPTDTTLVGSHPEDASARPERRGP